MDLESRLADHKERKLMHIRVSKARHGTSPAMKWGRGIPLVRASMQSVAAPLVALLLTLGADSDSRAAQDEDRFSYYILVDVSGSMVGKPHGSHPVIFPQVKKSVEEFVRAVRPGAAVSILPFHERIDGRLDRVIATDADRIAITDYVQTLDATGQTTWIYHAIREVLQDIEQPSDKASGRIVATLLLYTDGLNEGPDDLDLAELLRKFAMVRGEDNNLFLKYITLGVSLPDADVNLLRRTPGVELVENPKGVVGAVLPVEIVPTTLDFGSLAGGRTVTRSLRLTFPAAASGQELRFRTESSDLDKLGGVLVVEPASVILRGTEVTLSARLLNHESLGRHRCEAAIRIEGDQQLLVRPNAIQARFGTAELPIVRVDALGDPAVGTTWKLTLGEAARGDQPRQMLRFSLQGGVGDERVPVTVTLQPRGRSTGLSIGARLPGQPWRPRLQFAVGPESHEVEIGVVDVARQEEVGRFSWTVDLQAEAAVIRGNGLVPAANDSTTLTAQYQLKVDRPFEFPVWTPIALMVLGALACLAVLWWVLCRILTPGFIAGARFEVDDGTTIALRRRCLKRWHTVGGFGADLALAASPGGPQARICGSGPDLVVLPVDASQENVRDATGSAVDETGLTLSDGESLLIATVRVTYRTGT